MCAVYASTVCVRACVGACVDHPRACLYSNIYTNQQCTQTFQLHEDALAAIFA